MTDPEPEQQACHTKGESPAVRCKRHLTGPAAAHRRSFNEEGDRYRVERLPTIAFGDVVVAEIDRHNHRERRVPRSSTEPWRGHSRLALASGRDPAGDARGGGKSGRRISKWPKECAGNLSRAAAAAWDFAPRRTRLRCRIRPRSPIGRALSS